MSELKKLHSLILHSYVPNYSLPLTLSMPLKDILIHGTSPKYLDYYFLDLRIKEIRIRPTTNHNSYVSFILKTKENFDPRN